MTRESRSGVIVCLLAFVLGVAVGCGSSEGVAPADWELAAADAANMLPQTFFFTSTDVRQLRDDEDLAYFYNQWLEQQWPYWHVEEETGLHSSEIYWWVVAWDSEWDIRRGITICGGEFEMSGVRNSLSGDYYQDEYEGIEVWRDSHASVAIVESFLILGDADSVDQCIDTIGGGSSSLGDDADVALVLGQLSPSFLVTTVNDAQFPGMKAAAVGISKVSPRSVEYQMIAAFEGDEYAEAAVDEIQDSLGYGGIRAWTGFDVHRRGRLVEARRELDLVPLAGPPRDYETDHEVTQLATSAFYSDVHAGWDDANDDGPADYSDNVWGAEASDEGRGHYYPTAIASVGSHALTLSTTQFDPLKSENPRIEGGSGAATDEEIAHHAIWMGLLVNHAGGYGGGAGIADRELASPLEGETSLYLQDLPESAMTGDDRNGAPAPGGSYCWVVGRHGAVYGAYQGDGGHWYAGFSGNYP